MVAIDVVTAKGEVIRADAKKNNDLYWAARGCGPGFPGIVTRFHLQTRPVCKAIHTSAYIYPVSAYETAFSWILEVTPYHAAVKSLANVGKQLAPKFDLDTEIVFVISQPPDAPDPCLAALFTTFKSTVDEAHAALLPAESSHPADKLIAHSFNQPSSLASEFATQARLNPSGHRYFIDSAFLNPASTTDLVSLLQPGLTRIPSPETYSFWYHMARPHAPDMALSLHTEHYVALYTICKDQSGDAACEAYVNEVIGGLKGSAVGTYLGDIDLQERTTQFWGKEEWQRLKRVRREWDPKGRFCGYLVKGDGKDGTELDNEL